jgi:hypothetical protein
MYGCNRIPIGRHVNPYEEIFLFQRDMAHCFDFRAERMSWEGGESFLYTTNHLFDVLLDSTPS